MGFGGRREGHDASLVMSFLLAFWRARFGSRDLGSILYFPRSQREVSAGYVRVNCHRVWVGNILSMDEEMITMRGNKSWYKAVNEVAEQSLPAREGEQIDQS